MTGSLSLSIVIGYFLVLILISFLTSRKSSDKAFFTGDRNSPWYVVAFGMIGATLSGITFISVPGSVYGKGLSYIPMVVGFLIGYIIISYVLIPIYYRLNLTSIYGYLKQRFGKSSFKTGAIFFLISRTVGASLRLYLAAEVLDIFVFHPLDINYYVGVAITVGLIWVYTFKGGIKTIVWTDALQTACILFAVGASIIFIKDDMGLSLPELVSTVTESKFFDFTGGLIKKDISISMGVFNGIMIAIVMTGLDQDMMQKSLTCKTPGDSKKNMIWLGVVLIPVNLVFLCLGVLLFEHYLGNGLEVVNDKTFSLLESGVVTEISPDRIYPSLANFGYFPLWLGAVFLIGLVAAAYSSADSALTSLTTSFCIDIIEKEDKQTRLKVHIGMSIALILVVAGFKLLENDSVIWLLFKWAGLTYGPLLGLFAFGIFSKWKVKDQLVPLIAIASFVISLLLKSFTSIGNELLIVNGAMTFLGLYLIRTERREVVVKS